MCLSNKDTLSTGASSQHNSTQGNTFNYSSQFSPRNSFNYGNSQNSPISCANNYQVHPQIYHSQDQNIYYQNQDNYISSYHNSQGFSNTKGNNFHQSPQNIYINNQVPNYQLNSNINSFPNNSNNFNNRNINNLNSNLNFESSVNNYKENPFQKYHQSQKNSQINSQNNINCKYDSQIDFFKHSKESIKTTDGIDENYNYDPIEEHNLHSNFTLKNVDNFSLGKSLIKESKEINNLYIKKDIEQDITKEIYSKINTIIENQFDKFQQTQNSNLMKNYEYNEKIIEGHLQNLITYNNNILNDLTSYYENHTLAENIIPIQLELQEKFDILNEKITKNAKQNGNHQMKAILQLLEAIVSEIKSKIFPVLNYFKTQTYGHKNSKENEEIKKIISSIEEKIIKNFILKNSFTEKKYKNINIVQERVISFKISRVCNKNKFENKSVIHGFNLTNKPIVQHQYLNNLDLFSEFKTKKDLFIPSNNNFAIKSQFQSNQNQKKRVLNFK